MALQNSLQNFYIFVQKEKTDMTTRFYLDFRGRAADGKGSLLIILAHNNTTASISTGIRLSHEVGMGIRL